METSTIIALLLVPIITFVVVWYFGQGKRGPENYYYIDYVFGVWLAFFAISRLLGIIYFSSDFNLDWSLLPLTQPDQDVLFLQTWPWQFFRVTDGKFMFVEVASAFVLVELVFRYLNSNRLPFKFLIKSRNFAFVLVVITMTPLLLVSQFNDYLPNEFDPAHVLIILFINTISGLVVVNLLDDARISGLVILGNHILCVIMFNIAYIGGKDLLVINIVHAILIAVHLFKLAGDWGRVRLTSSAQPRVRRGYGYNRRRNYIRSVY